MQAEANGRRRHLLPSNARRNPGLYVRIVGSDDHWSTVLVVSELESEKSLNDLNLLIRLASYVRVICDPIIRPRTLSGSFDLVGGLMIHLKSAAKHMRTDIRLDGRYPILRLDQTGSPHNTYSSRRRYFFQMRDELERVISQMSAGDFLDIDGFLLAFRDQDFPGPQTLRSGAASNS